MDIDCDRLPVVLETTSRHAPRDLASLLDWCGAHREGPRSILTAMAGPQRGAASSEARS